METNNMPLASDHETLIHFDTFEEADRIYAMLDFTAKNYEKQTGQKSDSLIEVTKKYKEGFRKEEDGTCTVSIPDSDLYLYLYSLLDAMSIDILNRGEAGK